jgi:hypothetical protein
MCQNAPRHDQMLPRPGECRCRSRADTTGSSFAVIRSMRIILVTICFLATTAAAEPFFDLRPGISGTHRLCLDIENGGAKMKPIVAECGHYSGQRWKLWRTDEGLYKFTTEFRGDGYCLSTDSGARALLAPCRDTNGTQLWVLTELGEKNTWRVSNRNGGCLDIRADARGIYSAAMRTCSAAESQRWKMLARSLN